MLKSRLLEQEADFARSLTKLLNQETQDAAAEIYLDGSERNRILDSDFYKRLEDARPKWDPNDAKQPSIIFAKNFHGMLEKVVQEKRDEQFGSNEFQFLLAKGLSFLDRAKALRNDGMSFTNSHFSDLLSRYTEYLDIRRKFFDAIASGAEDVDISAQREYANTLESLASGGTEIEHKKLLSEGKYLNATANVRDNRRTGVLQQLEEPLAMLVIRNTRADTIGSVLNFKERIPSIENSFIFNGIEAAIHLAGARKSIVAVFGFGEEATIPPYDQRSYVKLLKFPTFQDQDYVHEHLIDDLFDWARHAQFIIDHATRNDQTYRVFIKLSLGPKDNNLKKLLSEDGLVVPFHKNSFENIKHLNYVRVISARVLTTNHVRFKGNYAEDDDEVMNNVCEGIIMPPSTTNKNVFPHRFGDGQRYFSQLNPIDSPPPFKNCNPEGDWIVKILTPSVLNFSADDKNQPEGYVLELVLRGTPSASS